jgi:hypothetical protein
LTVGGFSCRSLLWRSWSPLPRSVPCLAPRAFTATVSLVLLTLTIYETLGAKPPER